jgi:hypothetical protein
VTRTRTLEKVAEKPPAPVPATLGQATAVEQSRAVAEVQAAVVVAQQVPRSIQTAVAAMRESCAQKGLAERAFYRYARGGNTITGPSIHLARELARCWGNVQYGTAELRRDDLAGESEMQAFAWDVQTNTRNAQVFIVPHSRDTKQGRKPLGDLRDIYENNANQGARRLREAIFAILPPWFTEEAKDLCNMALQDDGDGKPLPTRAADAVRWFGAQFGIGQDQLERKLGRKVDRWTEHDLAQVRIIGKSLQRGEVTVDEEFPPERVTAEEVTGKPVVDAADTRPEVATPPEAGADG